MPAVLWGARALVAGLALASGVAVILAACAFELAPPVTLGDGSRPDGSTGPDARSHREAGRDGAGEGGVPLPCATASDCPKGEACDPTTFTCSPSCVGGLQCHGGCCDGVHCRPGTSTGACGATGTACVACSGETPTCSAGLCTATCFGACDAGSCCGVPAGTCITGTSNTACGSAGACVNCLGSPAGTVCLDGGCGCVTSADCPPFLACNAGVCTSACGPYATCNGGCCNASSTCVPGTVNAACGTGGANCTACGTGSPICLPGGKCGCTSTSDCNQFEACKDGQCGGTCDLDAGLLCHGGCCNGTSCTSGSADSQCGSEGGACADCNMAACSNRCVTVGTINQCGCRFPQDCKMCSTMTCNMATMTCE